MNNKNIVDDNHDNSNSVQLTIIDYDNAGDHIIMIMQKKIANHDNLCDT